MTVTPRLSRHGGPRQRRELRALRCLVVDTLCVLVGSVYLGATLVNGVSGGLGSAGEYIKFVDGKDWTYTNIQPVAHG